MDEDYITDDKKKPRGAKPVVTTDDAKRALTRVRATLERIESDVWQGDAFGKTEARALAQLIEKLNATLTQF